METVITQVAKDVKTKWAKVLAEYEKLPIEKKIQKIINIPIQDVKNIITESNK